MRKAHGTIKRHTSVRCQLLFRFININIRYDKYDFKFIVIKPRHVNKSYHRRANINR